MKREYAREFNYVGLSRLSHYEGDGEEEEAVWADPCWETKLLTAKRAKFLWWAILKECPWLETNYKPHFVSGRKYTLTITQDDTRGGLPHILSAQPAQRITKVVINYPPLPRRGERKIKC